MSCLLIILAIIPYIPGAGTEFARLSRDSQEAQKRHQKNITLMNRVLFQLFGFLITVWGCGNPQQHVQISYKRPDIHTTQDMPLIETFPPIFIDYQRDLELYIIKCGIRVQSRFAQYWISRLPRRKAGTAEVPFVLVGFRDAFACTTDEAFNRLRKMGYRPADLMELIAFSEHFLKDQRHPFISALGSQNVYNPNFHEGIVERLFGSSTYIDVPYLYLWESTQPFRGFSVTWDQESYYCWPKDTEFLAVEIAKDPWHGETFSSFETER